MAEKSPWDYMGPAETAILGEVVLDPAEQARWGRAMLFGTLPYMWREKATVIREMMYDKLALRPGDRVLIIGECVQVCGFDTDMQARMDGQGHIDIVDITAKARGAYIGGVAGRGGQLATWQWDYTKDTPDNHYDAVAILKPGRSIVLAEIALGPRILEAASIDVHIEAWVDKMFSRIGFALEKVPYYSPQQLLAAFDGVVQDAHTFTWKGIEMFWGRKPA
jgi:hypothetical protein